MAIQFVGAGAVAEGTTTLSVPYPSGIANGDLALIFVVNKYPAASPSSPSGWNTDPKGNGGAGTDGVDTGSVQVSMYSRQLNGTESGTVDFTISGGNSAVGVMINYRRYLGTGSWDVSLNHSAESSAGSSWSVTQGASLGAQDGDIMTVINGMNGNVQRSSAPTFTQTGVFTTQPRIRVNGGTNNGDDCSISIIDWTMSGGDSGGGTFADTITGDAASTAAGYTFFVRWRQSGGTFSLSILDGIATLAGHPVTVSVGSPPSGVTINVAAAVLDSAGQSATLVKGGVAVQVGTRIADTLGHSASVVPGARAVSVQSGILDTLGRNATVVAGPRTISVNARILDSAGHAASVASVFRVTVGARVLDSNGPGVTVASVFRVAVGAKVLDTASFSASVVHGAVAVPVDAGVADTSGLTVGVAVGSGPQTISVAAAVLDSNGLSAKLGIGIRVGARILDSAGVSATVASVFRVAVGARVLDSTGVSASVAAVFRVTVGARILDSNGLGATVIKGGVSVAVDAGVADTAGHGVAVVSGAGVIAVGVGVVASAGRAAAVAPGGVTVAVLADVADTAGHTVTVSAAAGPSVIAVGAAVLDSATVPASVAPGGVMVGLLVGALSGQGRTVAIVPGARAIPIAVASADTAGVHATLAAIYRVSVQARVVTAAGYDGSILTGGTAVPLSAGILLGAGQHVTVTSFATGGESKIVSTVDADSRRSRVSADGRSAVVGAGSRLAIVEKVEE